MAEPIITKDQMVARLGLARFTRVFDDNNDGHADKLSWAQIARDASGKVRGAIGLVFDVALLNADTSDELVRITLDVMEAMAARRRPTIMQGIDWIEAMKQADADLKLLRTGIANLGITTAPEPAANHGVKLASGNPAAPAVFPPKFSDNWGSF